MPVLGRRALIDIALPTGVSGNEIARIQMQEGMTAPEVIANAAAVIGVVNEELMTDYGGVISETDRVFARYMQGQSARSMTPLRVEFKDSDKVRSENVGHMLPINDYQDAIGWTPLWLQRCSRLDVDDDLRLIAFRWRNRFDYELFQRALTPTENTIGGNGYDVPWAIGSGVSVPFIPPQQGATQFDATHTHFIYKNDATTGVDHGTLLESMAEELRHHRHSGLLTAFVSDAELNDYAALDGFVELTPSNIQTISGATEAGDRVRIMTGEAYGIPGQLFGYYKSKVRGLIELRSHDRVPEHYAWMTRSYGRLSPLNGLVVREERGKGFGLMVMPKMTDDMVRQLDHLAFEATYGIGVNDRTNGVAGYIAEGASEYVTPTIS